ncbi:MAG: DUF192 domain-containing protein [bacterium]|nr:DUF192 domain-containing protein [bacterium]
MKITNNTKKGVIANDCSLCKSSFSRAKGLMFSKQKNLLFVFNKEKIIPLHMFFVFYSIDVIFLDEKKRIVELATLKPFTFFTPSKKAMFILELKAGTIEKTNTKLDDSISF